LFLFSTGGNQRETFDEEEFEDTKGVIRIRRRTDNTIAKRKSTKGQTTIYKTYT
jgi:hypothetical protein